ncbi:MAG: hypothetical protein K2X27_21155 [Candidatus Obscuribacterales bacterium]|nr:hypothetical protein [Candidatus Obscuribacterales bacterium]
MNKGKTQEGKIILSEQERMPEQKQRKLNFKEVMMGISAVILVLAVGFINFALWAKGNLFSAEGENLTLGNIVASALSNSGNSSLSFGVLVILSVGLKAAWWLLKTLGWLDSLLVLSVTGVALWYEPLRTSLQMLYLLGGISAVFLGYHLMNWLYRGPGIKPLLWIFLAGTSACSALRLTWESELSVITITVLCAVFLVGPSTQERADPSK